MFGSSHPHPHPQPTVKKEPAAAIDTVADSLKARQAAGSKLQLRRGTRGDDDDYKPNNKVSLPSASASMRRPRVRKDEAQQDTDNIPTAEPATPDTISQAVPADNVVTMQTEPLPSISSGPSTSSRPKRVRRQVRRRPSPEPLGSHNGLHLSEEVASVHSEEPDTPLALTLSRISAAHKSVDNTKKEPQLRGIPSTPSLSNSKASAQAPPSPSKNGEASSTPSLKIRLPGLANLHRTPLSTPSQAPTSTANRESHSASAYPARSRATRTPRASATVAPRERRSSRRDRASTSAPVQDTPASDADH